MPRKYVKKSEYIPNNAHTLIRAIKAVAIEEQTVYHVSQSFNIPKTNLYRLMGNVNKQIPDVSSATDEQLLKIASSFTKGTKTVSMNSKIFDSPDSSVFFNSMITWLFSILQIFTIAQEDEIKKFLMASSKMSYGLTVVDLRKMVYEFAVKVGIKYPTTWDDRRIAGYDWYKGFMQRHPNLTLRTPEQLSVDRAKAFCKANVDAFFANLNSVLSETDFEPQKIWNIDESGFPTVATKNPKVLCLKGTKRVSQIVSQERGSNVTICLAVNAMGHSIPPFYVFPRKNMRSSFLDDAGPGAAGCANESGWMTKPHFFKFMQHFIKHANASKDSPTLLLLDNHASHLSIDAINMATENGITMVSFPQHCSHKLQPLDVSVFGPVKQLYHSQCDVWHKNNIGKKMEVQNVPGIVKYCLDKGATPTSIKAGFKASGVYPYNPNIFTEEDFISGRLITDSNFEVEPENPDENRQIISEIDKRCREKLSLAIASTSKAFLESDLKDVCPLRMAAPKRKSNRGRKPMKSAVLTASVTRSELQKREEKSAANKRKKEEKNSVRVLKKQKGKQPQQESSSSSDEEDFCIICMENLPKNLTRNNSIKCNMCSRPVHLKCANIVRSYYTCVHCQSDSD